jgi:hypothetical protein
MLLMGLLSFMDPVSALASGQTWVVEEGERWMGIKSIEEMTFRLG